VLRVVIIPGILYLQLAVSLASAQTTFNFGGFAKLDVLNSRYNDGDVESESPLRDFYFPPAVPIGGTGEFVDIDFHVKESRFNFGTQTRLGDEDLKSLIELDFMLSPGGNERVSNSFNPRLRHFYFEYGRWMFGQSWSNFQIVVLPEDLDFIGVPDGTIFVRQPQIRLRAGRWRFSLENPETVLTEPASEAVIVTEAGRVPDVTVRYDAPVEWGSFAVAVLGRILSLDRPESLFDEVKPGFGINLGGKVNLGARDNLYMTAFAGSGLGRYASLNFVNSVTVDEAGKLKVIGSAGGWIGIRHWWNGKWRTSANLSGTFVSNPDVLEDGKVNKNVQSLSGNVLYSPHEQLTFGIEAMGARRECEDGSDGTFLRLQLSAKYAFNVATTVN
jgi:hypothetical protein